jgi:glycosyltransferase involved in cell wall biosynthesis
VDRRLVVSIGMPVYNGAQFICNALDSLLSQNYEAFEIIISDNASTDATNNICMEYANRDERIRYYRNQINMGASWNFNHVFDLSAGEYFMWASYDDYWDSKYIDTCLQTLKTSKNIVLAGTICRSIDSDTNQLIFVDKGFSTIGLNPSQRFIRYKSIIHSGSHIGGIFYGLYRKITLKQVMPIRKVIAADHLLLAELSLLGEFITVQKPLFFKRWGGASSSIKKIAAAIGINNRLFVTAPYFFREYFLQRIIFKCNNLSNLQKIKLAIWSFYNYLLVNVLKMTFMEWKVYTKRVIVKCCVWKK